ncbi:DUF3124 domain-containing protein [Flavobacteriaceae bacterium TP-CH-4]|uniref:DUF3124 domain-containing protein n=1 Tax=Pelagihabitans pacificus TaxID=2696054 RepID=A0A967EC94_9FLAO|nr:DUF3124 domain-containing protein [Pelagihabitans pacificus]NHF61006.1 DUF3124 domain-containing protein [Pelagihabitans pacificus]
MKRSYTPLLLIILFLNACVEQRPNRTATGEDELESLELENPVKKDEIAFNDTVYVPIYSDIYVDAVNQHTLLAATLSIRNTSFQDSLFVSKIDYYDTDGTLVKSFIDNTISIKPMATINYVIERENELGGTGANFIVVMSAKQPDIEPLVQAIMIGENGNKGFAFATDGYSIGK